MIAMTRHEMREAAFMLTFEQIFAQGTVDELVETAKECDHFEVVPATVELFRGVCEHQEELDEMISSHLKKWTISRISKVALAVLRLALYEMKYCDDIDNDIVISEAVKLTQAYSLKDDVTFVNGILGAISREM